MSSPFGPRLKASENYRYDFHRGIDIPADRGAPVHAIADGEIFRTYYEGDPASPYPGGGNVVILRHAFDTPLTFHGRSNTRYYSLYLHLDTILVNTAVPGGPYEQVKKGDQIGTVGHSGETNFNHLHFEIRVGTTCSLEYQLSHPDASCAKYFDTPQDPHINPLLLLDYPDINSYEIEIVRLDPLTIRLRSNRDELDFNEIRVRNRQGEKVINFNDRTGISPSNIDDSSYGGVTIKPSRFSARTDAYVISFEFANIHAFHSIEIKDIRGSRMKLASDRIQGKRPFMEDPGSTNAAGGHDETER